LLLFLKWSGAEEMQMQMQMHTTINNMLDDHGIVRLGWSTADISLILGTDAQGYVYGGTGMKVHHYNYTEYSSMENKTTFGMGDRSRMHVSLYESQYLFHYSTVPPSFIATNPILLNIIVTIRSNKYSQ
jgi:hypothetical protein